jgi:hypothetical protein
MTSAFIRLVLLVRVSRFRVLRVVCTLKLQRWRSNQCLRVYGVKNKGTRSREDNNLETRR